MRNLKRKIGVSVLAIACLGASAFGVQSALAANAEETVTIAEGLSMEHGASVSLNEEFSGIRWTTNVVASECSAASEIGVLVAPNVAAADLTADTEGAMKLKADLDLSKDQTFYTVIDYNEIAENYEGELTTEEALKKAYALELTARPYMVVNGEYQYADMTGINTARSARQVAIAAELAGEIDEKYRNVPEKAYLADNAEAYYGMTDKYTPDVLSIGAVGTPYIDLQDTTKTVTASIDLEGKTFKEAIIGAERVEASYADGTLTITEANYIPTGEHYITVFTEDGSFFTTPVIGATKVFDEMSDFEDFKYIRKNLNSSGKVSATIQETDPDGNPIDASKLVHDGYYVLADNIVADDDTDYDPYDYTYETSGVAFAGYLGIKNFADKALGLTGTFNGLGHYITDYRFRRNQSGLFELINGGTVKNFFLRNAKGASSENYKQVAGLAYYAIDATIENVVITTTTNLFADRSQVSMAYYLYQSKERSFNLRNVYVAMGGAKLTNTSGETLDPLENRFTGGVFAFIHGGSVGDIQWENVYVRNKFGLSVSWNDGTKDSETGITTYTMNYSYGQYGDQVDENGNYILNYFGKSTLPTDTGTRHYEIKNAYCCKGVYVYDSNTNLIEDTTKNISAFNNDPSKCWKWASQDATAIYFGGYKIAL